jgi:hypothetical protein
MGNTNRTSREDELLAECLELGPLHKDFNAKWKQLNILTTKRMNKKFNVAPSCIDKATREFEIPKSIHHGTY